MSFIQDFPKITSSVLFSKSLFMLLYLLLFQITSLQLLSSQVICDAQSSYLKVGERVRVSIADWETQGRIVKLTPKTMVITENNKIHNIPYDYINGLYVARGKRSNILEGLLIGGGGGALIGGLIGRAMYQSCESGIATSCIRDNPAKSFGIGALIGGIIGTAGGLYVGSIIRSTRWVNVSINSKASIVPTDKNNPGINPIITFRWSLN
jgi:hypothetical protein